MTINWFQAAILGLFACLCSNSCMAGQAVGNYTIGRPLVGGLVCGIILGDLKLGDCLRGSHATGLHRLGYSRWRRFSRRPGNFLHRDSPGYGGNFRAKLEPAEYFSR